MGLSSKIKYSLLVAGDVDLTQFDINKKVPLYVLYQYDNRKEIRENAKNIYKELINDIPFEASNAHVVQLLSLKLEEVDEMTDEEYFDYITKGMIYDKETGDALSDINPNGKYTIIEEAEKNYAIPLLGESFECNVEDILNKVADIDTIEKYSKHWDYIMSCSDIIKEQYISRYSNKEIYVSVMSEPFFYNAFVSNETGWMEQSNENQIEWVRNFKERFINKLPKGTKIKVYNFTK